MNKIVIAGAGTFGTSVAERLAWNLNNMVYLHTIETEVAADIEENHKNSKYFPTRFINQSIHATTSYDVFSDAVLGLNAMSLVPVALARKYIIRTFIGEETVEREESFSFRKNGLGKVSASIALCELIFFAIYIIMDGAGTRPSVHAFLEQQREIAAYVARIPRRPGAGPG